MIYIAEPRLSLYDFTTVLLSDFLTLSTKTRSLYTIFQTELCNNRQHKIQACMQ
jgi:hypothetical protein